MKKIFYKTIIALLIFIILGIVIAQNIFAKIEAGITNADVPNLTALGVVKLGTPEQEALYEHLGKPLGNSANDSTRVSEDNTSTNKDTQTYTKITDKYIETFMTYLNQKIDEVTGLTALRNFSSVFCLKHNQALRGWYGYVKRNHGSNVQVNQFITLTSSEPEPLTYEPKWNSKDRKQLDYLENHGTDQNGEFRKQIVQSHMRYFRVASDLYEIDNDFGTYTTNIFAYAATFSNKSKILHNNGNNLAQLAIWAVVGDPAMGEPSLEEEEIDVDIYEDTTGLDQTMLTDTSLINSSELWNAGAALDEYEAWLTANVSGDDTAKHEAAVAGTDSNLLNRPTVEINEASGADEYVDNGNGDKVGTVEDATGTTLQEINGKYYYKIGPFNMSDYALASAKDVTNNGTTQNYIEKYSGADLDVYKDMLGGIIDGDITFKNDSNGVTGTVKFSTDPDKGAQIVYTDMIGNATDTSVTLKDGNYVRTPRVTDDEPYVFPYPKTTFYILVNKDLCGSGATKLSKFSFIYRQTKAYGEGWVIKSRFTQTTWEIKPENTGCNSYDCTECEHDNLTRSGSNWGDGTGTKKHVYYCGGSGYCYYGTSGWHTHCSNTTEQCGSCGGHSCGKRHTGGTCDCTLAPGETCKKTHKWDCGSLHYDCGDVSRNYCSHGYLYGMHYESYGSPYFSGASDTDYCEAKTVCDSHSHWDCYKGNWNSTLDPQVVKGQTLLTIHDAQVEVIKTEVINELDVRLTTDVSIKKYIYDVEHVESDTLTNSGYDSTLTTTEGKARKNMAEDAKASNPVYVEYGDTVTYHIDLINAQSQTVKVRIKDILPEKCQVLSIVVDGVDIEYTSVEDSYFVTSWITVPKGTTSTEIKILVTEWEENISWKNTASIITTNDGFEEYPSKDAESVDYVRTAIDSRPGPVVNIAEITGKTLESSDYYQLNNYQANIDKFISAYDDVITRDNNNPNNSNKMKITDEKNLSTLLIDETKNGTKEYFTRYAYSEEDKLNHPLSVEKGEYITYSIMVSNDSVTNGLKKATQVRPTTIIDRLEIGLYVEEKAVGVMYDKDGKLNTKYNSLGAVPVSITKVGSSGGFVTYKLEIDNSIILNPGEYILFTMKVGIDESNMYLYDLENNATLNKLTNINHGVGEEPVGPYDRIVKDDKVDVNHGSETSSEYVKMKDLVISGRVWLDRDKDGLMDLEKDKTFEDESINVEEKPSSDIDYSTKAAEKAMECITVKLYQDVGKDKDDSNDIVVRKTKTDENGIYTFGRSDELVWYPGEYSITGTSGALVTTESEQRIPKADNKDSNKNYTEDSNYIDYYVEFEYDGVLYKSTEIYAGMSNLNNVGKINNKNYYIDSNAKEFTKVREEFNKDYEYISYNVAYECSTANDKVANKSIEATTVLEFDKQNHESYLRIDQSRRMTARSFIVDKNNSELIEACKAAANSCGANAWKSCSNHWKGWKAAIDAGLIDPSAYANNSTGREQAKTALKNILKNLSAGEVSEITKYLWLYPFNDDTNYDTPETDYLKYINLGLEEREEVDISLTKDVYEVKTTVNGEEVSYNYDQLQAEGPNSRNGEIGSNSKNYLQDYIIKKPYGLTLYESDFKYRFTDYKYDEVRNHKTAGSELNIEITYKISVDSKAITNDYKTSGGGNIDVKLDTRVHEIVDLYDENFIELSFNDDGSMKTDTSNQVTIREKDTKTVDGETVNTLKDKNIIIGQAWYYPNNDTTKSPVYLTLTNKSAYSGKDNNFKADGYNTVYISGMENVYIEEGKNLDIYVKYVLDKDDTMVSNGKTLERVLEIIERNKNGYKNGNVIEGISQVNAYSVWYNDSKKPASIVDCDSNVGNIGLKTESGEMTSADNSSYYEDTVYKTGIEIKVDENGPVRELTGTVWDDSRSTTPTGDSSSGTQYIGNGYYDSGDKKQEDAELNETLPINYKNNVTEEKDIAVRNAKAEYVEIISIIGSDGKVRYYEEQIDTTAWEGVQETRTGENGEYKLLGYIPGYYVVRFTYGDGGETALTNIDSIGRDTQDMLVFNGQDYKSTQYTGEADTLTDYNQILKRMQVAKENDARDDEIRRLETIAYSEVMVNRIAEILKGITNGTDLTPNNDTKNTVEQLKELTENTYMFADTVKFYVKPEKLGKLTDTENEQFGVTTKYAGLTKTGDQILYKEVEDIEYVDTSVDARAFQIKHIDFGIEYRPESQIELSKRIATITLTPSDNQDTLVELVFDSVGTGDDRINVINKEKSKGLENVQFISNGYKQFKNYAITSEAEKEQGFVFINVDEEILQGCTLEIGYEFIASNKSEVDRINQNLDELRYKENAEAKNKQAYFYTDDPSNENYKASRTAANILKSMYGTIYDLDGEVMYTTKTKTTYETDGTTENGYYGRFLSENYYTGNIGAKDVISSLKFDKILDYVDTDLVFKSDENLQKHEEDTLWSTTSSQELNDSGLLKDDVFTKPDNRLLSPVGVAYDTFKEEIVTTDSGDTETIKQPITSNLVVSVDDRIKDPEEYSSTTSDPTINVKLSRFLKPDEEGTVTLKAHKVISAETMTEDMSYENIAEVIQFTTSTGRRTNYATTIGNADLSPLTEEEKKDPDKKIPPGGSPEYHESTKEPDTSAVEEVTLQPPTGLTGRNRLLRNTVDIASKGIGFSVIAVALVLGGLVLVKFVIKKIKKRPIK